ncbi:MAG: YbhB/YbcL family Raf kinase inhibitor-like protein [Candidatus Korobacteraceae bacterium]
MRRIVSIIFLLAVGVRSAAAQQTAPNLAGTLALTSPAFGAGSEIPKQDSCKGADISPTLAWSGAPSRTVSFALIVDDPDAPHGTWVHWVLWNLPAATHALPEAEPKRAQLDDGSQQGQNSFHKIGYNGPCPPGGQTHRYFFRLYALDVKLNLPAGTDRAALDGATKGHVLAQTEYMGTFHQ